MLRIYFLISILLCNFTYGATQQEADDKRVLASTELQVAGENKTAAFTMWYDTLIYAAEIESAINSANWEDPADKTSALNNLYDITGYLTECWTGDYEAHNTTLSNAQTSYNDSTTEYNAEDWTGAYVFANDAISPANTASNGFANLYILANQKNSQLYDLWLTIPW